MNLRLALTYVLPIRWTRERDTDLTVYLQRLSREVAEIIVVDGSPAPLFEAHRAAWTPFARHIAPHPAARFLNGKVNGTVTGVAAASHERIVIADDDVRYALVQLERVAELLEEADLVRPQNYFSPMPWHAVWDTARSLINRAVGGDFPGTLGVRRTSFLATGGYDGDVLFENLELIRTIEAAGGRVSAPPDLFVARRPPEARRFFSQRVQQAYDDLAIPARMAVWLSLLPAGVLAAAASPWWLAVAAGAAVAVAEGGRNRAGGRDVFPFRGSLAAPVWLAERAVSSWLAVGHRILAGGYRYAGTTIERAATPRRRLRVRAAMRRERLNRLVAGAPGNDACASSNVEGGRSWPNRATGSRLRN